jgi:hypothetical protein
MAGSNRAPSSIAIDAPGERSRWSPKIQEENPARFSRRPPSASGTELESRLWYTGNRSGPQA